MRSISIPPGAPGLPRVLTDRLIWMGDCLERYHPKRQQILHAYHSTYLLTGDEHSAAIDTGHPKDWSVINAQLDELHACGAPQVRYLVPTHPEVPHSASLARWLDKYPSAEVVGEIRDFPLVFPEYTNRLQRATAGDSFDLGGISFSIVEAVIRDLPPTVWVYVESERILFPADGFAYLHEHQAGQCGKLAEEVPDMDFEELTAMFSDAALYFTRFTNMEPILEALDSLLERHPSDVIAPAHGLPILDPPLIMPRVWEGLRLGSQWESISHYGLLPEQ